MIATRSATIYMQMTLSCTLSDHHRITQMVDDGWIFLNEAKTEAILFFPPSSTRILGCPPSMYVEHPYQCRRLFDTYAFYSTADLTCRPKYRTSVVLLIRIYFVLQKYERVSQLQRVRPSSTPSSLHGWERCPVRHIRPPLAPPRDGTALGGQSRPTDQTR